jgi:spermidine synthase
MPVRLIEPPAARGVPPASFQRRVSEYHVDFKDEGAPGASAQAGTGRFTVLPAIVYASAFVTGAIVMSFEILGSRYLNPYFGSGIYTWASLISTVLAALCIGYFLGGWLADRRPSMTVLGATVIIGSCYLLFLPLFSSAVLDRLLSAIDDVRTGSLVSSFVILFFPVMFLGMYSPFAIRLLLRSPHRSGVVSGTVYGISTLGSIVGTLGTTFYLIPLIGTRSITISLGVAGVIAGLALIAAHRWLARGRSPAIALLVVAALGAAAANITAPAVADELIDAETRAAMLKREDGRIARIETEHNDIYITKRRHELIMSFQLKGLDYTESVANLSDPDDLPVRYTQIMTVATVYPTEPKRILMIGLGGGSISTYLGRFMPEVTIDTIEVDSGVTAAAKTYFGIRETARVRYLDGDGRVFLNRNKQPYDLILVDAYHGGFVPFHLLTKEFYTLVKERLAQGGAAAFNVHDGSKLYASTIHTLRQVFASVDLYTTRRGEVIAVATASAAPDKASLERRAAALQARHRFRFPLPELLTRRLPNPQTQAANGEVLTDDFAPVHLYGSMREGPKRNQ